MAVSIGAGTTFEPSAPVAVFGGLYNLRSESGISYAVVQGNKPSGWDKAEGIVVLTGGDQRLMDRGGRLSRFKKKFEGMF